MSEPDSSLPGSKLFGIDPLELLERAMVSEKKISEAKAWQPPSLEELSRLLPQYKIEGLIGTGGMGSVYKGRQVSLDRPVAIKILPPELAEDYQFVLRFQREARTLAKLHHPGIVAVYESGQTGAGHLYFVMEYVEGTDLRKILRQDKLDPEQALIIVCHICNALQAAHKMGIVHRDIKPENILISNDGEVKLADFGLSRPTTTEEEGLTMTNIVMGTPDYMSPEQKSGKTDERSDIYALGVVFYEMLTGHAPRGAFDPPSHKVQVDVRLDGIVLKALQESPERRYQHVDELSNDVDHVRTTPLPASIPENTPATTRQTRPLHFWTGAVALLLAVLLGGVLLWSPWRQGKKPVASVPTVLPPVGLTNQTQSNQTGKTDPLSEYETRTNNGLITITKYNGQADVLEIPHTINGLPVVALGHRSFEACTSLKSVTIPDGVTFIGGSAFSKCPNLISVTIPSSVTTIIGQAFHYCPRLTTFKLDPANPILSLSPDGILFTKDHSELITYPNGKADKIYVIPNGCTTIGEGAFASCTNLTSVTITEGVKTIEGFAFQDCLSLTDITIPSSVTGIGGGAFNQCKNLTKVVFLGNAPAMAYTVFRKTSPDFKIYYHRGATGFTSPLWTDRSGAQCNPEME